MTKLLLRFLAVLVLLAIAGIFSMRFFFNYEDHTPKTSYLRLEQLSDNKSMAALYDELQAANEAHIDLDHRNADGLRPVDLAASKDQGIAAAAFLVAGSNINAADAHGDTVMHIAVRHHALHVLKELRRFMPDLAHRNNDGLTPVDLARQMGDGDAVAILTAPFSPS